MNEPSEIETTAAVETADATADATTDSPAPAPADLSSRPAPEWLDEVEGEIGDVDIVLKCLARDSTSMCTTCHKLDQEGQLADRAVLVRCSSTKQPR